jgi:hypothetical protein
MIRFSWHRFCRMPRLKRCVATPVEVACRSWEPGAVDAPLEGEARSLTGRFERVAIAKPLASSFDAVGGRCHRATGWAASRSPAAAGSWAARICIPGLFARRASTLSRVRRSRRRLPTPPVRPRSKAWMS